MNTCIISGNLGSDPESVYTNEGTHIVNFPVAFKSTKDKTCWVKICCFNKTADVAETYLHKGAKVGIIGILDQDKWEDNDGNKRTAFKLIANSIEFIKTDGRGFENGNGNNSNNNNQNDYDENDTPF